MENLKKNPLSLQLNVEDFAPASNDEKKSLVVMRESVNFWKDGMRRLRKNKIAMVSLVVILLIAFMAYVLPSFWPYSYEQQIKGSNNLAPFEYSAAEQKLIDQGENVFPHILGTDRMGRDFAVRVMMGTRVSLSVGLLASVLVLLIGATYGAISAFAGGWIDNIMMRITDILYTIPDILLIILLAMAILQLIYAIDFRGAAEHKKLCIPVSREIAITAAALVLYALLLPVLTFFPCTLALNIVLCATFARKENEGNEEAEAKKMTKKQFGVIVLYSVILTIVLWLLFTQILKCVLP